MAEPVGRLDLSSAQSMENFTNGGVTVLSKYFPLTEYFQASANLHGHQHYTSTDCTVVSTVLHLAAASLILTSGCAAHAQWESLGTSVSLSDSVSLGTKQGTP